MVNSTGGLIDTVVHMSPMAERMGTATGYVMQQLNSEMLGNAMGKIAELSKDKLRLEAMQQNAMQVRVDWSFSSKEYANLYKYLLQAS